VSPGKILSSDKGEPKGFVEGWEPHLPRTCQWGKKSVSLLSWAAGKKDCGVEKVEVVPGVDDAQVRLTKLMRAPGGKRKKKKDILGGKKEQKACRTRKEKLFP